MSSQCVESKPGQGNQKRRNKEEKIRGKNRK